MWYVFPTIQTHPNDIIGRNIPNFEIPFSDLFRLITRNHCQVGSLLDGNTVAGFHHGSAAPPQRSSVVQDDVEERAVDPQVAIVVNKAQLAELIQKEIHPGARRGGSDPRNQELSERRVEVLISTGN